MIPEAYITSWRKKVPWTENFQVEQDLIIERSLVKQHSALVSGQKSKKKLVLAT